MLARWQGWFKMPNFWLHINHPNDKAKLHAEDGCTWARRAIARKQAGLPYGRVLGDKNGVWLGPFKTVMEAEENQAKVGKNDINRCRISSCQHLF